MSENKNNSNIRCEFIKIIIFQTSTFYDPFGHAYDQIKNIKRRDPFGNIKTQT